MAGSLHVPATVVQRIGAVLRWLLPYVSAGLIAGAGFGYHWLTSRVGRNELAVARADLTTELRTLREQAFHASTLADAHQRQVTALWSHVVALEAELYVHRTYARASPTRIAQLIEQAKQFYALEYDRQLTTHTLDPAEACRLALLANFRPAP